MRCSAVWKEYLTPADLGVSGVTIPLSDSDVDVDPCSFLAMSEAIGEESAMVRLVDLLSGARAEAEG